MVQKDTSLGIKVKSSAAQNLIHGSTISYCPERRVSPTGKYGTLDEVGDAPEFLWSGLNGSFSIEVNTLHEEIAYNPVHSTTNILELQRNAKIGEELGFSLSTVPQTTAHFPLLKFITGSELGLGDEPDSTSWLKELDGKFSLFTGIMFNDYKCDIPGIGVAKETVSGFAGHRAAVAESSPAAVEAIENLSAPVIWNDIKRVVMGVPEGLAWNAHEITGVQEWADVTYGNGLYVAVADGGGGNAAMTSADGVTWTKYEIDGNHQWFSVTYGNGLYVAVAKTGTNKVSTSPDGVTWTNRESATEANEWEGVAYGNGLYVAVSGTGTNRVMTSADGITWVARESAVEANTWCNVTYANDLFVAVARSGTNRVMTSPDGITWTARASAAESNMWASITYGNNIFVAVARSGTNRVMTSSDGATWTARLSATEANNWKSVTYGDGLFVAVARSGTNRVMTSPDGVTWTARASAGEEQNWQGVTYGNSLFVSIGDTGAAKVMTSASSVTSIAHCLSDVSFGFAAEVKKETHPESSLSTKIKGIRVTGRKMSVSLKLTWVDQTFLDLVTGSTKQYLKIVIGTSPNETTLEFGGLYWPQYLSKAEPKELVGATITCIVDQPSFSYSTA